MRCAFSGRPPTDRPIVTATMAQVSAAAAAKRAFESLETQRVPARPARVGRTLSSCRSIRAPLLPPVQLLHPVLIQRHAARLIRATSVAEQANTISGFQNAASTETDGPIT